MEILFLIVLSVLVGGSILVNVRTSSKIGRALGGNPVAQPKAIEAPANTHTLVRTWIAATRDGNIAAGWRWKCSCGVWGVTTDAHNRYKPETGTTSYSIGTEKQAIKGFKDHAQQYNEANTDYYRAKYEKLQADFAEYRKLCYCKDANDALILWKEK